MIMTATGTAVADPTAVTVPAKEVAATQRDTRAAVDTAPAMEMEAVLRDIRDLVPEKDLEMAMDLVKDLALNPVRMMDTLEVEMVLEMEEEMDLVPRDIRAVALEMEMDPVKDLVPNLDQNLMMDTLEVATAVETVVAVMMLHPLIP